MSSLTKLLALLNKDNPAFVPFSLDNVALSQPIPDSTTIRNTKITISAIPGNGSYTGQVSVFYDRVDVNELIANQPGLMSESPITFETIVSILNNDLAADILATELEPFTVPDMAVGDIETVVLTASQDSLGWKGTTPVDILYGLPFEVNKLHQLVNFTLPENNYLTQ